jgi:tRNA pseudouridine13 synthase
MLSYLSKLPGTGGKLKQSAEHFVVEEVLSGGTVLEMDKKFNHAPAGMAMKPKANVEADAEGPEDEATGAEAESSEAEATEVNARGSPSKFTHFILQKRNWGTMDALRAVGKRFRCGIKRFSYAGLKDRNANTVQLCGAFGLTPEQILSVRVRDISINGAWPASDKVRMGQLRGNRFTLVVEGTAPDANAQAKKIFADLGGKFPNYFGPQRFGMRGNSHEVGACMVKGDFEGACMRYLCDSTGEENMEAREARAKLKTGMDFAAALKTFPFHLRYERLVLERLAHSSRDFAGAIRTMPRGLTLIFVHALQSHVFNQALSERIRAGEITSRTSIEEEGNLIGYESKPTAHEKKILEALGIELEHFRMKGMPELSSKGTKRALLAELENFECAPLGDGKMRFKFSLDAGSYATSAMREFLDAKE